MTYQVIARKWRPQSFDEVTGQGHITRTLRNAIEHDRLHHAYLFSGARGVGKTTTARLLAKALNCHKSQGPTTAPCRSTDPDICPSCREVTDSRSIDVLEIDAASNTGVENVREQIIGSIAVRPARDRYKVFIIDEVHMLSGAAFNALLKTLEEPPPRVLFIMATTEMHKVPDTILSRCQQFQFRTIATSKIFERLNLIAESEGIKVDQAALQEIARAGEGSMRDAQSAFDQVISFTEGTISVDDVEAALGIASSRILIRTMNAVIEKSSRDVLEIVEELVSRGQDLRNFCRDLMVHTRDLLMIKATGSGDLLGPSSLHQKELAEQSKNFSESDLTRLFQSLTETETSLRQAAHPRYQLELGLVKLVEIKRLSPLDELVRRLEQLENSIQSGGGSTTPPAGSKPEPPKPTPRTQTSTEMARAATVEPSSGLKLVKPAEPEPAAAPAHLPSGKEAVSHLMRVLEERRRPLVLTALESARSVVIEEGELRIEFSSDLKHMRDTLAKPENIKLLREICKQVLGKDVGVLLRVGEGDQTEPTQAAENRKVVKEDLRQTAENHPVVQQFLRTFHGEILEVKRVTPDAPE
jgi:DNA polymerase III subunit gamma/tau